MMKHQAGEATLTADAVSFRHRDRPGFVLRQVRLHATPGSITALTGPNGSGKSTLLRLLAGLLIPDEGRILSPVMDPGKIRLLTEEPFLPGDQTVGWHVRFHALLYGAGWKESSSQVGGVLEELGLESSGRSRCSALSRGMKQRVALARVLVGTPVILLLDEPGSNLDCETLARLYLRLRRFVEDGGVVIVASHREDDLSLAGDRRITLGEAE